MKIFFHIVSLVIRHLVEGKDISRALMNYRCEGIELNGTVLDLGAGKDPPYYKFMKKGESRVIKIDIDKNNKPDVLADLEREFPFKNCACDCLIAFNVLEHLYNHDYFRYSKFALHNILSEIGFKNINIESIGFWIFTVICQYTLRIPIVGRSLVIITFPFLKALDDFILRKFSGQREMYTLEYFVWAIK